MPKRAKEASISDSTKSPINPSKPLSNPKHEIFARNVVKEGGSASKAYLETYKDVQPKTAYTNGPRLLANTDIKNRVTAILDAKGLSLPDLTERLRKFADSENEGIGLDATKTGFKLHGCFDEQKSVTNNIESIEVSFNQTVNRIDPKQAA